MKRVLARLLYRTYTRRFPNARLRHFERQLAAANSSPFAAWLTFSDEATSLGLTTDWRGMVEDLEAEGSQLIGASPCRHVGRHGDGDVPPEGQHFGYVETACYGCGAIV